MKRSRATGLDGWTVVDMRNMPWPLLHMLAQLLNWVESHGVWPEQLATGYIPLIPKGEGSEPLQLRPLSVLSAIYGAWSGIRLRDCLISQEKWVHRNAFAFRPQKCALDAATLLAALIERAHLLKQALSGAGTDYVKCFDLIPQQISFRMAREFGLDPKPQAALEAMYQQLHRAFKINGALGSFFHATNGVLQGCAMSVLMINMLTTLWMRAVDELEGAISVTVHSLPPIPPKLEEPKELRYRRKPSQSTAVSRFRPPPAPSRCVMKTFGSGIDQFEYWEHSNPGTCGHGPPPPPQQSQLPHPSSAPEPARDGLVEEEMAASEESPPPSPAKLRGAQPQPQEAGTIQVGSMGYADDTYPLRSEGQYMAPVMQLTDEWLALTLQKVNPKKSLSIQVRQSKEIARKYTVLQGISLPLQAEFRSLGVGIRTSLTRGTGPLLKKRTSKGVHLLSRVRGAQGGFSRRTHIIATLVQAAALWGTPGAEVSRRDLQSLETAVLHSLWGTSRPGRAKEIIFVLLVQGHRVSPHMKITYDRVCWLLAVARTPGTLQVVVQSCIEARQAQVRPTTSGPVQRALLELESLGWRQADHWWVWNVPGVPEEIDMTLINEDKFKHILRDSIRRRALLSLEDRRPRQFQGILGALDREACQVLLSEGTEFDKALLRGWLTGALWTAARAHARGLRATPLCPYCSRQQEEDDEHILWACPAWGIHRSGAWRSLMRTARALGLSDQISS